MPYKEIMVRGARDIRLKLCKNSALRSFSLDCMIYGPFYKILGKDKKLITLFYHCIIIQGRIIMQIKNI